MNSYNIFPMDKPLKCSGCNEELSLKSLAEWNAKTFGYCADCAKKRETK